MDHNSTTPLSAEAAEAMAPWQHDQFGNPASQHAFGRRARRPWNMPANKSARCWERAWRAGIPIG